MNETCTTHDATVPFTAPTIAESPLQDGKSSYAAVRFNAMTHGILSRLTVLPHEDQEEFADLLAAQAQEHQPAGATEAHLVEEMAGIIWRKRRVLQAEGAKINQDLKNAVRNAEDVIPAAAPFEIGLSGKNTDLRDLVPMTPEDAVERKKEARRHDAIKAQALGEGLQVHRLENLNRYEIHLDRKFERTLAMLVKLKEFRGGK